MNKEILINQIKNIENISKYSIKGGTAMFNKEYPQLLIHINKHTKEMQKYASNNKLVAKLIYLKNYDGDIKKITINNKIMIYDYRINSFKEACINATQKQWNNCINELSLISEIYDKDETINLLKNDYKKYFGKSGNRKLLRDNKKLYLSVLTHTSDMNNLNRNLAKFSFRLHILINNINIYCNTHNYLKHWSLKNGEFYIVCGKCEPKYPSINWFKKKYGIDWRRHYDLRISKVKLNKCNSLQWFKNKYGKNIGESKYREYVGNKMNTLSILKANRYSKISQELFWNVYNNLEKKDYVYFFELNQEFVLRIPEKYNYNKTVMMLDFIQNKKIIEYNGKYWHSSNIDDVRYSILKDMGFDVMIITSDEYKRNMKNNKIIEKCVNFLQC